MTQNLRVKADKLIQLTLDWEKWYIDEEHKRYYPSVTWILDYYPKGIGFRKWLATLADWEEGQQILNRASERGRKVHQAIERLLRGLPLHYSIPLDDFPPFEPHEWQLIQYFTHFYHDYKPIAVTGIEQVVINKTYNYAGTVDLMAYMDVGVLDGKEPTGELAHVLIDFKTSSNIYETHKQQVAAYCKAADIKRGFILHLGSKHKKRYNFVEVDVEEYFKLFLHTYAIFKHEVGETEPKIIDVPEQFQLVEAKDEIMDSNGQESVH